ncbi:TVP38/TMEM64 family protein [Dichotomicrobium thermohalophilum]|uniref:TVP38/TMEM64 family protein n=1 Tax=Dichotomicrobium thermohalophilum TaxID=933063 RepID=UPI001AECF090|nr:VTT domain-containing protein [Dichotomicrobium thermohalophilum]
MTDENTPPEPESGAREPELGEAVPRRPLWRRLMPLILLAAAAGLILSQGWHNLISFQQLALNQQALQAWINENLVAALAVYAAIYVVVIALSLPGGAVLTVAGGLLFGWLLGGVVTVLAATLGATAIFLIARSSVGEPLAARAGPWLNKFRAGFQENALSYLLFLRLVPVFPFWVVNLAPALLGVSLRTYVITTALGIIPGTFAFAFAGAGLDSVLAAQREAFQSCQVARDAGDPPCSFRFDPGTLITTELLIAFAALGIVALIPAIVKKLRQQPKA